METKYETIITLTSTADGGWQMDDDTFTMHAGLIPWTLNGVQPHELREFVLRCNMNDISVELIWGN